MAANVLSKVMNMRVVILVLMSQYIIHPVIFLIGKEPHYCFHKCVYFVWVSL